MIRKKDYGLYAVHFENGVIKVGKSIDLQYRIRAHIDSGRGFGIHVKEVAMNPTPNVTEDQLIDYCRSLGGNNHYGEWFKRIPFDLVRAYVLTGLDSTQRIPRTDHRPRNQQLSLLNPDFFRGPQRQRKA